MPYTLAYFHQSWWIIGGFLCFLIFNVIQAYDKLKFSYQKNIPICVHKSWTHSTYEVAFALQVRILF